MRFSEWLDKLEDALGKPIELDEKEINKHLKDDEVLVYHPSVIERLFSKFRRV